jgi:hypothetical protein
MFGSDKVVVFVALEEDVSNSSCGVASLIDCPIVSARRYIQTMANNYRRVKNKRDVLILWPNSRLVRGATHWWPNIWKVYLVSIEYRFVKAANLWNL